MLFGRRIDIHKNCVSFPEKIECFLELLAFYPVSVSQFNRDPKVAGQLQHVFKLIEFMFARRRISREGAKARSTSSIVAVVSPTFAFASNRNFFCSAGGRSFAGVE